MHGDRGNGLIPIIMVAVCITLHLIVIPIWMWSLGL